MISLHEPSFDATDEQFLLETIRSSWVSTGGPFVDRFEREFAQYIGAKHAVSVVNGTVGLQLMLDTLSRTKGIAAPFEVLIPTLTFAATAAAVVHAGGRPVLVDCAEGTFNLDVQQIGNFIRSKYRREKDTWVSQKTGLPLLAIMPAHIMGWTCDMSALASISSELNVSVLEDAAEAFGCCKTPSQHVGRDGLASCFSFNGNKILTTGAGGMIVTDSSEFAARLKHLSTTAKTDALRFCHDEVGYNYRMPNLIAALGCSQLAKMPARLSRKKSIFEKYLRGFEGSAIRVYNDESCISNHWLVNVVFQSEELRERALKSLLSTDIQARPLWTPIHRQSAYKTYLQDGREFPNSEWMWKRTLSLPSSPQLEDESIDRIVGIILASQDPLEGTV